MRIPEKNIKNFIKNIAKKNNVSYVKSKTDILADTFTVLSDNALVDDNILNLIIALYRNNIIDKKELMELSYKYIKEKG